MCNGTPFTVEKISPRVRIELSLLDQRPALNPLSYQGSLDLQRPFLIGSLILYLSSLALCSSLCQSSGLTSLIPLLSQDLSPTGTFSVDMEVGVNIGILLYSAKNEHSRICTSFDPGKACNDLPCLELNYFPTSL